MKQRYDTANGPQSSGEDGVEVRWELRSGGALFGTSPAFRSCSPL